MHFQTYPLSQRSLTSLLPPPIRIIRQTTTRGYKLQIPRLVDINTTTCDNFSQENASLRSIESQESKPESQELKPDPFSLSPPRGPVYSVAELLSIISNIESLKSKQDVQLPPSCPSSPKLVDTDTDTTSCRYFSQENNSKSQNLKPDFPAPSWCSTSSRIVYSVAELLSIISSIESQKSKQDVRLPRSSPPGSKGSLNTVLFSILTNIELQNSAKDTQPPPPLPSSSNGSLNADPLPMNSNIEPQKSKPEQVRPSSTSGSDASPIAELLSIFSNTESEASNLSSNPGNSIERSGIQRRPISFH
jgi:hypothetical protein